MSGFKLMRTDKKNNEDIQKWQKKEEIGHKLNKYTMYLKIDTNTQMLNKELNDVTRKTCAVVVRGILWCCFFTKDVTFFIHLM